MQLPIGLEANHKGLINLIDRKAYTFEEPNGYVCSNNVEK